MRKYSKVVAWGLIFPLALVATAGAATEARVPLVCSRGPGGQQYAAVVTLPSQAAEGATYSVRIDGVTSGAISHTGLKYIHDMTTEYSLPAGTSYVEGSLRLVPGTGTANVSADARVAHDGARIRLTLPGKVESGSSYTAPSFEFQLKVTAKAGASLPVQLLQYRVRANAIIVGDVDTTCDPNPKPYSIGTTRVTSATP